MKSHNTSLAIDHEVPKAALESSTFWDIRDENLLRQAISNQFVDHTLPPGRILAGDRVVSHLRFTAHLTGVFKGSREPGSVGMAEAIEADATPPGSERIVRPCSSV
jgi:hypothetical protein